VKDNLPKELDFEQEAKNNWLCAANLERSDSSVRNRAVVPSIEVKLTTPRVLTMEFIDGVPITDAASLAQMGAAPSVCFCPPHTPLCTF
jgi:aarF domain-containing kinase